MTFFDAKASTHVLFLDSQTVYNNTLSNRHGKILRHLSDHCHWPIYNGYTPNVSVSIYIVWGHTPICMEQNRVRSYWLVVDGIQFISSRDFETNFWEWYGKVMKMIRYNKHIKAMWLAGWVLCHVIHRHSSTTSHVYGFIKKEEANQLLEGHPVRTFLVRFSESHAGQFAISYINNSRELKQYLVRPEEWASHVSMTSDWHVTVWRLRRYRHSWTEWTNSSICWSFREIPAVSRYVRECWKTKLLRYIIPEKRIAQMRGRKTRVDILR